MTSIIAAVDQRPVAALVLEAATRLAALLDVDVCALRVDHGTTSNGLIQRYDVPLREVSGDPADALLAALAADDVAMLVLGARGTPGYRRSVGHVAAAVIERATKPVVVIPRNVTQIGDPLVRVLVPLEGSTDATRAIEQVLEPILSSRAEVTLVHVLTDKTAPMMDRPGRDLDIWSAEFAARHVPDAARVECRVGAVGPQICAACREADAHLVVLSWSQDQSADHGAVVRDVLADCTVPVMLVPSVGPDIGERRSPSTAFLRPGSGGP